MKNSVRIAIALAATLLLAPTLTACGGVEGMIEQLSGGEIDVSIGSLPDGWPTEVPVIDGEIIGGGTAAGDDGSPGWNATIKVASAAAFGEIKSQLEGAGFTQLDAPDVDGSEEVTSGAFKNDNYGVIVAVTGADGNFIANYTVVEGGVE